MTHQESLFDNPVEQIEQADPEMPNHLRMAVLRDNEAAGFLPATKDELTEAFSLLAFQTEAGKTARHLNEILLHQRKANTDNPQNAVRLVTREYGAYAVQALYDLTHLSYLSEDIAQCMNPNVSLAEDIGVDHVGVPALARYIDLRQWVRDRGQSKLSFDPLKGQVKRTGDTDVRITDPYTRGRLEPQVEQRIAEIMDELSIGESRSLIKEAIVDQNNRYGFWKARLEESQAHTLAKPIAETILASF